MAARCSAIDLNLYGNLNMVDGILNQWAFGEKGSLISGSIVKSFALLPNYFIRCRTYADVPEALVTNVSNL